MPDWKKTEDGKRILQQRKMAEAYLDLSEKFEAVRKKHRLNLVDCVQVLDELMHTYLRAKVKRRWM